MKTVVIDLWESVIVNKTIVAIVDDEDEIVSSETIFKENIEVTDSGENRRYSIEEYVNRYPILTDQLKEIESKLKQE